MPAARHRRITLRIGAELTRDGTAPDREPPIRTELHRDTP